MLLLSARHREREVHALRFAYKILAKEQVQKLHYCLTRCAGLGESEVRGTRWEVMMHVHVGCLCLCYGEGGGVGCWGRVYVSEY